MADAFTRAKMRFLDRGMHDARATYGARMVLYEIVRHLNRVSGDAWPSQETIARNLGMRDTRTVIRAVQLWVRLGYFVVEVDGRSNTYRPIFEAADPPQTPDKLSPNEVDPIGDKKAGIGDKNHTPIGDKNRILSPLSEPKLQTALSPSSSTSAFQSRAGDPRGTTAGPPTKESGRLRPQRGDERVEALIAKQFGPDGYEILGKLNEIDDGQPMLRLFSIARAYPNARIPQSDIEAARLAATRHAWRRRA